MPLLQEEIRLALVHYFTAHVFSRSFECTQACRYAKYTLPYHQHLAFEPAIPASDKQQTYALDRATTGTSRMVIVVGNLSVIRRPNPSQCAMSAKSQCEATLPPSPWDHD